MIADEEVRKLFEKVELLTLQNEQLQTQLKVLQDGVEVVVPAFEGPLPMYRLLKPFYGPDDHYYDPDEGDEVIEWTGIPNESMEPMNEPAEKRMRAYLASLPIGRIAHEYVIEASMMLRPREGEIVVPLSDVMKKAAELQARAQGKAINVSDEIKLPHKEANVPLMGNSDTSRARKRRARGEMLRSTPDPEKPGKQPARIMGSMNEQQTF